MTDKDLVKRTNLVKQMRSYNQKGYGWPEDMCEGADEIEKLWAEITRLRHIVAGDTTVLQLNHQEIEKLRQANADLIAAMNKYEGELDAEITRLEAQVRTYQQIVWLYVDPTDCSPEHKIPIMEAATVMNKEALDD